MKLIIHDLGPARDALFKQKHENVFHADGKYAPCQGCFDCWTKSPAQCRLKDSLQTMCRLIGRAEELVIITENLYGAYSAPVKTVLDRSIGISTPMSGYRGRQMHHTLRYGMRKSMKVIAYGDMTESEKETFRLMAERNRLNFGYETCEIVFLKNADEVEGLLL